MSSPSPQDTTTVAGVQRPANALTLATFGTIALVIALWSAWCLGWMGTNAAFNLIVILPLTLVAGYDIQLVRFHKRLAPPPLTIQGRIKASLFWGIIALVVMQVIWKQRGFVAGLLGVSALVEALCAFLHFLDLRHERKLAWLSVLQSLLHATGWLFYFGMAINGIDSYVEVLEGSVNLLAGFPPALQDAFLWCADAPGVAITCYLALALVGASFVLRFYLYARCSGMPFKGLLNPLGKSAIGLFLIALTFHVYAMAALHSRWITVAEDWSNTPSTTQLPSLENPSSDAQKFADAQKTLGQTLVSLAHKENDEDAPYAWGRYCSLADNDRLAPWYPPEFGADQEDREAMAKYLDQLKPSLDQLDELLNSLNDIPDAQIAGGTYLLAEWRFRANAELNRWDDALRDLTRLSAIACHQAKSLDMTQRLRGIHRIVLWTELQKRIPEECRGNVLTEAKRLHAFLEALPHAEAIQLFVRNTHDLLLEVRGEFRNWGIAMPYFHMMATADDIHLLQDFQNIDNPAQVVPTQQGQRTIFLYCAFVQNSLARVYHYELETALGRLGQIE